MSAIVVAAAMLAAATTQVQGLTFTWASFSTAPVQGEGTVYGAAPEANAEGACSFGSNYANSTWLPWSDFDAAYPVTFIAMNAPQFAKSVACGSCIWFKGTGSGVGVESKRIPLTWQFGLIDNLCPECPAGNLDLARSYVVGDGIWAIEWFTVPCPVGRSPLYYTVTSDPTNLYYFSLVISNTLVPVAGVEVQVGSMWQTLTRSNNNQWPWNSSPAQVVYPVTIRITPVCGAAVIDNIPQLGAGWGSVQFSGSGCSGLPDPVNSGTSRPAATAKPTVKPTTKPRPAPSRLPMTLPAHTGAAQGLGKGGAPTKQTLSVPTPRPTVWPYQTFYYCKVKVVGSTKQGAITSATVSCVSKDGSALQVTGGAALQTASKRWSGVAFQQPTSKQFGSGNTDATLAVLPRQHTITLTGRIFGITNNASPALVLIGPSNQVTIQNFVFDTIEVVNTTIARCKVTVGDGAAGIYANTKTRLSLQNSTITTNSARYGAVWVNGGSSIKVAAATFEHNAAAAAAPVGGGGAIQLDGCTNATSVNTIIGSTFGFNQAAHADGGAIITKGACKLAITKSLLTHNTAMMGAAIFASGCSSGSSAVLISNTIISATNRATSIKGSAVDAAAGCSIVAT